MLPVYKIIFKKERRYKVLRFASPLILLVTRRIQIRERSSKIKKCEDACFTAFFFYIIGIEPGAPPIAEIGSSSFSGIVAIAVSVVKNTDDILIAF